MGNQGLSYDPKSRAARVKKATCVGKLQSYVDNYGKLSGNKLSAFLQTYCIETVQSSTYLFKGDPLIRKSRDDVQAALEKAYSGKWTARIVELYDAEFTDVAETITWIIDISIPYQGKMIPYYYLTRSTFDVGSQMLLYCCFNQYNIKTKATAIETSVQQSLFQAPRQKVAIQQSSAPPGAPKTHEAYSNAPSYAPSTPVTSYTSTPPASAQPQVYKAAPKAYAAPTMAPAGNTAYASSAAYSTYGAPVVTPPSVSSTHVVYPPTVTTYSTSNTTVIPPATTTTVIPTPNNSTTTPADIPEDSTSHLAPV